MWLPRSTFKTNLRKAKFITWPVDSTGSKVGGESLYQAEIKRVSSKNCEIPDAALDAVFDTWAWGASIATPDKVEVFLNRWRSTSTTFDLSVFQRDAVAGRSVTGEKEKGAKRRNSNDVSSS